MAITIDDFSKIWASTSPLTPYEFGESNYKEGWNFVGATPPSRQMWDFLQKNNDEKMQYLANNYLPLSGGTLTGQLVINKNNATVGNQAIKLTGAGQNFIISASDTGVTKGTVPSSTHYWGIDFYGDSVDAVNKRIGLLETALTENNVCSTSITAYNCTTNTSTEICKISVIVDGNGNAYTYAPTPANGDNSTKIATTAFVYNNYHKVTTGQCTILNGEGTSDLERHGDWIEANAEVSNIISSANTWNNVLQLPSGFLPKYRVDFAGVDNSLSTAIQTQITLEGIVRVWSSISSFRMHVVYLAGD